MRRLTHAEELLQSLGISAPSEIDLEAIAWSCNAEVKEEYLDGCEAQIIGNRDRAIIIINKNSILERKHFSIGHELGHWRYHRGRSFICRSDDIGNNDRKLTPHDPERIADDYAADLLMPTYLFELYALQAHNTSFDVILNLKEVFSTSITATALRFIQFSPQPSMLICHGPNGRKWFKHGKYIPDSLFPRNEIDTDSFAFEVLFSDKIQSRPQLIGADAWFDKWDAGLYELYEHSIKINNGLILTLLSWYDESMLEKYED